MVTHIINNNVNTSQWSFPIDGTLRVGAELKFPVTTSYGEPVSRQVINRFWQYLMQNAWIPLRDKNTCTVIGATLPQKEGRHTVSCETGYCKLEFALAPVSDLFALKRNIDFIQKLVSAFQEEQDAWFLGLGIHPVAIPSAELMARNARASVWDQALVSNKFVPPESGHDLHLFTLNAGSHVHVNVPQPQRIAALNILNAFVPAQLALTANSTVWKGEVDQKLHCVNEMMWEWWLDDPRRFGIPDRPFENYDSYFDYISALPFIFAYRNGDPIIINERLSFSEYTKISKCAGIRIDGNETEITPCHEDLFTHYSCCWHCNRLTRYNTVENRTNDQQPPGEMVSIAALTLGLISALPEALEEIKCTDWTALQSLREQACSKKPASYKDDETIYASCLRMLSLADLGLQQRKLGEEVFLQPLHQRVQQRSCPSQEVSHLFSTRGIRELVQVLAI